MRDIFKIIALFVGFSGVCFSASGQDVRPRVNGLETDSVYMSLLRDESRLKIKEDSLLRVIRDERSRLMSDTTNLYNRSQQILRMEELVFGLRNEIGATTSKINTIEQDFILNNLFSGNSQATISVATPSSNYPNLIDNDYFRENLTPEEYGELVESHRLRAEWYDPVIREYESHYQRLVELSQAYDSVMTQTEANELYEVYRQESRELRDIANRVTAVWDEKYNQELYLYSYLLDKLNRMDDLAKLNEMARTRSVYSPDEVMSVALAGIPEQRELLSEYEFSLADALNLSEAKDSLERARKTMSGQNYAFPKIELKEKEFVHYEFISFPEELRYTTENPIPELWIPESGTYYSVTVGNFSQRQAVSVFRGAVPVYYQRVGGQWRYYIGLFRSYGDALDAAQELKDEGFRRPEPVRWVDGKYENLAAQSTRNAGFWRIIINVSQGELPEDVRFVLNRYARSKEVTRVGNVFYVGTFTDKLQVDEVMQGLQKITGIGVDVEELEE